MLARARPVRALRRRFFASTTSSTTQTDPNRIDEGPLLVRKENYAKIITLNRPNALNALNKKMVHEMREIYANSMLDADLNVVLLEGAGNKAFCAGGDVVGVVNSGLVAKEPQSETPYPFEFFRTEYHADYLISQLNTPHVAFIDGFTMGGGVGISVHGTYRVATEKSVFAMPETGIGLFPDVGGSYFLPRLPQEHLGRHLALTGQRVKGGGALKGMGLATHAVPSDKLDELKQELIALDEICPPSKIGEILDRYDTLPAEPVCSEEELEKIAHAFEVATFDAYWQRMGEMRDEGDEWAIKTIAAIEKMSPLSVKITFEQMKRGAVRDLAQAFEMEFIMVQRCLREHDFYEGVRALLVDKDHKPKWQPATLEEVTDEMVESYFEPDDDFALLKLPQQAQAQAQAIQEAQAAQAKL